MAKITDVDIDHPSQDRSGRFPLDALLRRKGWAIRYRIGNQEPLWVNRRGKVRLFSKALATLDPNDVADAEYEEFLYFTKFE